MLTFSLLLTAEEYRVAAVKQPGVAAVRRDLRRLPDATPTARSVTLDVAARTDHARLGRDRFYQACALRDCPHNPLRGVP